MSGPQGSTRSDPLGGISPGGPFNVHYMGDEGQKIGPAGVHRGREALQNAHSVTGFCIVPFYHSIDVDNDAQHTDSQNELNKSITSLEVTSSYENI